MNRSPRKVHGVKVLAAAVFCTFVMGGLFAQSSVAQSPTDALGAGKDALEDALGEGRGTLSDTVGEGRDALEPLVGDGASLLRSLGRVVGSVGETVARTPGEAGALLGGEQGILTTASNLLCPPTRSVDDLVQDHLEFTGLGVVTGSLSALVCAAGMLEFEFRTVWRHPDGGEIVRYHSAVLGVPTLMDVGDSPGNEIQGTIGFSQGFNLLTLRIDRVRDTEKNLPLQVEAILSDSQAGLLDDRSVAFGYDTREDSAPRQFSASTPLGSLASPDGSFGFVMGQSNSQRIALIGGLFRGTPDDRQEATAVRLDYGPQAPNFAQVRANLGGDHVQVDLESDRVSPATISGEVHGENGVDKVDIEFEDLPQLLSLGLDSETGTISYEASSTVDRLEADISTATPFFLSANHFKARMLDLPTSFELSVGQGADGLDLTTSNPIGQLDLQARSDGQTFPEIPEGEAGAILDATSDELAFALRIFELRHLGFSLDPIALTAHMGGGRLFTADVKLDQADELGPLGTLSARIELDQVPDQVTLGVDPDSGQISYDGSAGMDRLEAWVSTPEPIFLGAEHFYVRALDVPQSFQLGIGQDDESFELSTDNPIGQLDLQARSDGATFPEIADGETGAILHATDGALELALRVFGLRQLGFSTDPIALSAHLEGGHLFTADVKLDQEDELGLPLGAIEALIELDQMPSQVSLSVDPDSGEISYDASDTMDRLEASISTPEPILLGAEHFSVRALEVPESFSLGLGEDTDALELSTDNPIGQLDLRARSDDREFPEIPAGEAGATLDTTEDQLALAMRIFGLRHLGASFDPIGLNVDHDGGRLFTIDATLGQEDELGNEIDPVEALILIDEIPDQMSLELGDLPEDEDGEPTGSALSLSASDPIDFVRIAAQGLELFEGADSVEAEINDLPTNINLTLPTGEGEPLAKIAANDNIGQLRLSASDGSGELPARSIGGDPVLNDLFKFRDVPGEMDIALRLSVIEELSVNLDPIELALEQDGSQTRPIDIEAALEVSDAPITADGVLDKPGDRTSLSLVIDPDGGASIVFDNSDNVELFELAATGLPGIDLADLRFDNVSPQMTICLEQGGGCQRPNPNPISGGTANNNRPYPAEVSMDFDDHGTHGSGAGPAFRTTMNAGIQFEGSDDDVEITNLRFRNLSMDFGQGPNFSGGCTVGQSIPRIYMFFSSRRPGTNVTHPFAMNSVKYPPMIQDFRIGTDGNPARATDRIAWLRGCTGFLNLSFDRASNGGMSCGGQSVLNTQLGFLTINLLNFLGTAVVPLCGGSVQNPEPW